MNFRTFIYLGLLLVFLSSCEEKMVFVPDNPGPPETDKVVLIEELTGATCPNCPKGAAALASILEQFEGAVIGVGIHGEQQAEPVPNLSIYDFRNPAAAAVEASFSPFLGKPSAVINRVKFENQDFLAITGTDTWSTFVETELDRPNEMNVFPNLSYDPVTRQIDLDVVVNGVESITGDFSLTVYLTQSHIIDAQEDVSDIILDFEFNHVLMDAMTNPLGDSFFTGTINNGDILSRQYSYTLPENPQDGLWIPEDMEVIAFITNVDIEDPRVIQAAIVHLQE